MRLAIGAGRGRLIRQMLVESMLLFLLGGAAGLALARVMTTLLVSLLPTLPVPVACRSRSTRARSRSRSGCRSSPPCSPAWRRRSRSRRREVVSALKDDARGGPERLRLRNAFVVGQVAFSIVLVVGAGLFVRALQRATRSIPASIRAASSSPRSICRSPATPPTPAACSRGELIQRVRELPGVQIGDARGDGAARRRRARPRRARRARRPAAGRRGASSTPTGTSSRPAISRR